MPYRTVPEGKMQESKARFPTIYNLTKNGTITAGKCLFYGFATHENTVFCRESYKNAQALFDHVGEINLQPGAMDGMKVKFVGPAGELDKLKAKFGADKAEFFELDEGSMFFAQTDKAVMPDKHVSIMPFFTVPDGKMAEFKKHFGTFYECTKNGTGLGSKQCLYYGFAINGNTVYCREGYVNAAGALAHANEVKEVLGKAIEMVGRDNLDISVIGPKAELEKLKEALGSLGPKFYDLDDGAMITVQ